jgi:zinc/manganese transport system ATP-binding protein
MELDAAWSSGTTWLGSRGHRRDLDPDPSHSVVNSMPLATRQSAQSHPASAVTFDNVTLGYDGHPAVHHLSGMVKAGSLLAIVGPNGSGKSTLLKGIVGALKPIEGRIVLSGMTARNIAYLPQATDIDRSFPATVLDLLTLGLLEQCGLFGRLTPQHDAMMRTALHSVGLTGFEHRQIETLSGGQLQRCMFARVLLQDAPVILLDEPFNAIDAKTVTDLIALIQRWHGEARTIIAVLHDMQLVRETFPETLLLARHTVAWGPTREALTAENLLKARRMTEAWNDQAPWCEANTPAGFAA